jgi:2-oxoisovalerate dehydrogenase E2 component (dihydrolipoyl transacylase)
VKPPATVQAFDQLCEVQSDKASVEITSPFDGVLKELLVEEGAVAKVGEGLCLIEVEEEAAASTPELEPVQESSSASPPPHTEQEASAHQPESAQANPPSTPDTPFPRRRHPLDPQYVPDLSPPPARRRGSAKNDPNVLATPSMRHLARTLGVDLSELAPGSGRDGRIEKSDIDAHLAKASVSSSRETETPKSKAEDITVELGRTRWGMWKAMEKVIMHSTFYYLLVTCMSILSRA